MDYVSLSAVMQYELSPFLYDAVKFAPFNYYNNYLLSLLINFWSIIEHNRLTLKA